MNAIFPFLTTYDPPGEDEGSIDPLGLYQIADQLGMQLVPAVRERMQRIRFLTAMAVGAIVTEGLEGDLLQRDASPYILPCVSESFKSNMPLLMHYALRDMFGKVKSYRWTDEEFEEAMAVGGRATFLFDDHGAFIKDDVPLPDLGSIKAAIDTWPLQPVQVLNGADRFHSGRPIERDPDWPGMWRVKLSNGHYSDMVNLTRAKDAAVAVARGLSKRVEPIAA